MYGYMIEYSYYRDGRRIKEEDEYWGNNTQEAVNICRAENIELFADYSGRIEKVWVDNWSSWDIVDDWE